MRLSLVPVAIALSVVAAACGAGGPTASPTPTPAPTLTDAQVLWCSRHDVTGLAGISDMDNAVIKAADALGIAVPSSIVSADSTFAFVNMTGNNEMLNTLPEGWMDDFYAWRTTADYARACIAAFELK